MSPLRLRRLLALVAVTSLPGIIVAGCGADNALVGGSCAEPYTQCGLRCVDLENDPGNCGACGEACPPQAACVAGGCVATSIDGSTDGGTDASPQDASEADASPTGEGSLADAAQDAEPGDGASDAPSDGLQPDGSAGDGASDGTVPDGEVDGSGPDVTVDTGGADGATDGTSPDGSADGAPDSTAGDSSGGGIDGASCAPLQDCGGTCVDVTSDALNCGGCGIVCPSQICIQSKCVGATSGSVVFIGHDFATTPLGTVQARVLSNAVFLWPTDPVNVLSYERYADTTALGRIHAIIGAAATSLGRTVQITSTSTDADIPNTLAVQTYGVLLVADQVNAQGGVDLGALGSSWASTVATFTQSGGIVVILDGGTGAGQMPAFASGTGLLSVTAQASVAGGTPLYVLAPSDSMSLGILSPYAAGTSSVTITTEPNQGSVDYVIGPAPEAGAAVAPTVVHKVF